MNGIASPRTLVMTVVVVVTSIKDVARGSRKLCPRDVKIVYMPINGMPMGVVSHIRNPNSGGGGRRIKSLRSSSTTQKVPGHTHTYKKSAGEVEAKVLRGG